MSPFILLALFTLLPATTTATDTLTTTSPTNNPDLAAERSALLHLRSSVGIITHKLHWDTNQTSPCNWSGVACESNRVTSLRIPAASLVGQIPVGIFGNLSHLKTLSLRLNFLNGPLPLDLGLCVQLRYLFLQGNKFTGDFPEMLLSLKELVRLDLADNQFSGEIPNELSMLKRLKTLYLEGNVFSGVIPEIKLQNLEKFNVSNNKLNGRLPKSLKLFGASAFGGNVGLCGAPLKACVEDEPLAIVGVGGNENVGKNRKLSGGVIAGIVIGCVIGILLILVLVCVLCRRKSVSGRGTRSLDVVNAKHVDIGAHDETMAGEVRSVGSAGGSERALVAAAAAVLMPHGKSDVNGSSGSNGVKKLVFFGDTKKVFDLEDLLRASAEVLGKGTFGTAYKAVLDNGLMMVVKRLKDVIITEREFREKIEVVGAMDNQYLVPLRAFYFNRDEKLLVLDYMPMGSLSALLHGNTGSGRTPLSWNIRSSIALGAARGIAYLHSQGPTMSHGNIKSSNILLTTSYEARVSDFGLAQLVGPSSMPNRVSGYRAPEVTDPRKVSQKADVYSFGVLLLELLTGKAPTHAILNEEGVDLPRWVQSIVREEWSSEVFDVELLRYQNAEEQMVQLLQLAIDCSAPYPDNRPSMNEVAKLIDEVRRSSLHYHNPMYDVVEDANNDDASHQQYRDPPPSTHVD